MSRRGLLAIVDYHLDRQKALRKGKSDEYGEPPVGLPQAPELPDDYKQVLRWEREYIGAYVSDDPLQHVNATSMAGHLADSVGAFINIIGIVQEHEFRKTRKGTPMSRFSIVDLSGPTRAFCFGQLAKQIDDGCLGHFRGEVVSRDEDIEYKATAFKLLERY